MRRSLTLMMSLLLCCAAATGATPKRNKAKAVTPAQALAARLARIARHGVMVGHQDATFYGTQWKWDLDRSDVKSVCGDYPAVLGCELGRLELDSARNLDGVPFDRMRDDIRRQYERDGIITISWHPDNPATGKNAWDPSGRPVEKVLPGGELHQMFMERIDRVARFLLSLRTAQGQPIPVIFRPWHEMSGGWFWWGKDSCTPEQYQQLFRMTIDRLRELGINHCVYCYSPGGDPNETDAHFLLYYPGDKYCDMVGCDVYGNEAKDKYIREMRTELDVVCRVARQHGKMACVAETGSRGTKDPKWFTTGLWEAVKDYPVSYLLLWRNAPEENFGPAPEKTCADDFRTFHKLPRTLFAKDVKKIK